MIGLFFGETQFPKLILKKIKKTKKKYLILDLSDKNIFKRDSKAFRANIGQFGSILKLLREKKGFLSEYSQSTVGEDMAETFSFLMIENSELRIKLQNDDNLKKKINFIKSNIQLIDQNFKFIL